MKPRTEQNLRDAWSGPMTAQQVARKHHQGTARSVQRFWKAEQDAGRLPHGARPHFRHRTTDAAALAVDPFAAAIDAGADLDLDREIAAAEAAADCYDARTGAALYGCRIADGDPLLTALERAHGKDRRRAYDDRVFDDITVEPSAKHCRAQRKFRDRAMTMVAKNPTRFAKAFGARA